MNKSEVSKLAQESENRLKKEGFMLIAGPCSAESESQVMNTAYGLKQSGVDYFRAGLWKPRTRPGNFEGVGIQGVDWMVRVQREMGMKIVTEVANCHHVETVVAAGFNAVWIGARTTANPFSVQEIAEALSGSDMTVFIKNPVNPDLQLWIGAVERLKNRGIKNVIAVHRGFSPLETTRYRNVPIWSIPLAFMDQMPEIKVLCDPSHIAGSRKLVGEISRKAVELKFDGLFIESHFSPSDAKSDREQQITPREMEIMLSDVRFSSDHHEQSHQNDELALLRKEIDCWDQQLLSTLRSRMRTARRIGEIKKEKNFQIIQMDRWNDLLTSRISDGLELGLSKEFLLRIFEQIHGESLNFQNRIRE